MSLQLKTSIQVFKGISCRAEACEGSKLRTAVSAFGFTASLSCCRRLSELSDKAAGRFQEVVRSRYAVLTWNVLACLRIKLCMSFEGRFGLEGLASICSVLEFGMAPPSTPKLPNFTFKIVLCQDGGCLAETRRIR